jgi:hypothetical protein
MRHKLGPLSIQQEFTSWGDTMTKVPLWLSPLAPPNNLRSEILLPGPTPAWGCRPPFVTSTQSDIPTTKTYSSVHKWHISLSSVFRIEMEVLLSFEGCPLCRTAHTQYSAFSSTLHNYNQTAQFKVTYKRINDSFKQHVSTFRSSSGGVKPNYCKEHFAVVIPTLKVFEIGHLPISLGANLNSFYD